MSGAFQLTLVLHIAAAIGAAGPLLVQPALRRADALPVAARLHTRVTIPSLTLAGLLGFGLVGLSDDAFTLDQAWIHASIATWVALIGLTTLGIARGLANGNDRAVRASLGASHLLVVVALVLMVVKPGL